MKKFAIALTLAFAMFMVPVSAMAANASKTLTITVAPADLTVTTASLPGAKIGTAYSATLAATGGIGPYTWAVTTGALPPGITLSPAGVLSGTPTAAGTYTMTFTVTDTQTGAIQTVQATIK